MKAFLFISLFIIFTCFSCSEKRTDYQHNVSIIKPKNIENKVLNDSKTVVDTANLLVTKNDSIKPKVTSTGGGTNNTIEDPGGNNLKWETIPLPNISGGPSNLSGYLSNSHTKKNDILSLNYFAITIFMLLVSVFLLHLSSESWLRFIWYRDFDLKDSQIKNYQSEINEQISLSNELLKLESNKFSAQILKEEIIKLKATKNSLEDNLNHNPDLEFKTILDKNFYVLALAISFFLLYYYLTNQILNFDHFIFNENISLFLNNFNFPLLIIASYFSTISLFRFVLIQGSYKKYSKNNLSIFGVLISILTASAAIITIFKFLSN